MAQEEVLIRKERIDRAVFLVLLVELAACCVSFVDEELACVGSALPLACVVAGREQVYTFVIHVVGVVGVTVYEGAGVEEELKLLMIACRNFLHDK